MIKPPLVVALVAACVVAAPTHARSRRHHHHAHWRGTAHHARSAARQAAFREEIVAHPRGCPARLFCGCGAAVEIFGAPIRSLWLAANWLRFPRAPPAPGMVAARRGHVFVLRSHISGPIWLVYDANSGRGLTRVHARSIAGYAIVNPQGGSFDRR